jgi:hypothetical protein
MGDSDVIIASETGSGKTLAYLIPIIDKCLQNIITIDKVPVGPLSPYVKHVNQPKLSPFHTVNPMDPIENCTFAVVRYPNRGQSLKNSDYFLTEKDVPSLLAFVQTSGYTIDYNMTKLIQRAKISPSSSKSKTMICSFSYQ